MCRRERSLARSLLSMALDEADPDVRNVVALLDGIPGAYEQAQLGLKQAGEGRTIPLAELVTIQDARSSSAATSG